MRLYNSSFFPPMLLAVIVALTGCATIKTMPSIGSYDTPKIYSGARLDLNAATDDESQLKRFNTTPPDHPMIDFPFSAILDTIILPVTIPVALYEIVFGH